MLLENPSTYLRIRAVDHGGETQFLREVLQRTGCSLLLDVNNVHVSCVNHRRDPRAYPRQLPMRAVSRVHWPALHHDLDAEARRC